MFRNVYDPETFFDGNNDKKLFSIQFKSYSSAGNELHANICKDSMWRVASELYTNL